ncbi:MAG: hypothetical protein IPJ28_11040 [Betaproteobacteria bacterium]|nr:hypothetical protein [Betaproteobacteria bacterium]
MADIVQFLEREIGRVSVELASPSWLIYSKGFRVDILRSAIKRARRRHGPSVARPHRAHHAFTAPRDLMEDRGPIFYRQCARGRAAAPSRSSSSAACR